MRWLVLVLIILMAAPVGDGPGLSLPYLRRLLGDRACAQYTSVCRAVLGVSDHFDQALARVPPEHYPDVLDRLLGEFDPHARVVREASGVGIGVLDSVTKGGLFIHQVYGPALRAGLRRGDRIARVNGRTADARSLRAPVGTVMALDVWRGSRAWRVRVPVEKIARPDVEVEALGDVAHVQLHRFTDGVCAELRLQLTEARPRAVVFDLRGNPGGELTEGRCVAGLWLGGVSRVLGERPIAEKLPAALGLESENGALVWETSWNSDEFAHVPLVVLIDQGSASSAEFVAAALQDHGRALVVGERSFGKGEAQAVESLKDAPAIRVAHTVSLIYRPNGQALQFTGVIPDVWVPSGAGSLRREEDLFHARVKTNPSLIAQMPRLYAERAFSDPARWPDRQLGAAVAACDQRPE